MLCSVVTITSRKYIVSPTGLNYNQITIFCYEKAGLFIHVALWIPVRTVI